MLCYCRTHHVIATRKDFSATCPSWTNFVSFCNLTYNFLHNCVHFDLASPPEKKRNKSRFALFHSIFRTTFHGVKKKRKERKKTREMFFLRVAYTAGIWSLSGCRHITTAGQLRVRVDWARRGLRVWWLTWRDEVGRQAKEKLDNFLGCLISKR